MIWSCGEPWSSMSWRYMIHKKEENPPTQMVDVIQSFYLFISPNLTMLHIKLSKYLLNGFGKWSWHQVPKYIYIDLYISISLVALLLLQQKVLGWTTFTGQAKSNLQSKNTLYHIITNHSHSLCIPSVRRKFNLSSFFPQTTALW